MEYTEAERKADRKAALDLLQANRKPLLDAANAAMFAARENPYNRALAEAAETAKYAYRITSPLGQDIDDTATMIRNERLGIIPGKSAAKRPYGERGGRRHKSKKHRKSKKYRKSRRYRRR